MFVYAERLDELRTQTTEWLMARRDELVREQRRLRVEELAVTAVLDERNAVDDSHAARDGVSARDANETLETARALASLPAIADAAHAGEFSEAQLRAVTKLADPGSDAEWARRARHTAPADLAQLARCTRTPTEEEGRARRAARELAMWWRRDAGMLAFKGQLPDVDGALFEAVVNKMIDEMRPAKGEPWETRARRGADALMELVRNDADHKAVLHPSPLFVVQVPPSGPATIAGIPLPDGMVENLRASAKVKPVLLDEHGIPVAAGRRSGALSPRIAKAVLLRDGHCRMHCDRRHGLQIHHLWPVSWGGTDEIGNLATVCVAGGTDHHEHLAPHGHFLLLGNPNRPDGLRLVHRDELPAIAHLAGLEAVLDLNGHRAITDPELLDRYLQQIRAGPVAA